MRADARVACAEWSSGFWNHAMIQTITARGLRAGRPRSQRTPELWSRYHAARSRAKHTPANAETLTLRIPVPPQAINGGMGRSGEPISSMPPLDARIGPRLRCSVEAGRGAPNA